MIPGLLTKLRLGVRSIEYPSERLLVFFDDLLHVHEQALEGRPPRQQEALYRPPSEDGASVFAALDGGDAEASQAFYAPGDSRWDQAIQVDEGDAATASAFIDFEQEEQNLRRLVSESSDATKAEALAAASEVAEAAAKTAAEAVALTEPESAEPADPVVEGVSPLEALSLQIGTWIELKLKGQWVRAQLTWQSPRKTMFVFVSGSGTAHSMSKGSLETLLAEGKVRLVSGRPVLDSALDAAASAALRNAVQNTQLR
jgi:hypothetical protein